MAGKGWHKRKREREREREGENSVATWSDRISRGSEVYRYPNPPRIIQLCEAYCQSWYPERHKNTNRWGTYDALCYRKYIHTIVRVQRCLVSGTRPGNARVRPLSRGLLLQQRERERERERERRRRLVRGVAFRWRVLWQRPENHTEAAAASIPQNAFLPCIHAYSTFYFTVHHIHNTHTYSHKSTIIYTIHIHTPTSLVSTFSWFPLSLVRVGWGLKFWTVKL